jgi:hypothetical protein
MRVTFWGRGLFRLTCLFVVSFVTAQAEDTGSNNGQFSAPAKPPVAKAAAPATPQEVVTKIKKENEQAVLRIAEIEKFIYPLQEQTAQKIFGLQSGEYTFLRMQAQTPQSATQFFDKLKNTDRSSFGGIVSYFDEAYDALQKGDYWVGREGSLVSDDSALFAELEEKVLEEIRKRPDGDKVIGMIAERDLLLKKLKTSKPLYSYFNDRRLWWKSYPEYEAIVKEESDGQAEKLSE